MIKFKKFNWKKTEEAKKAKEAKEAGNAGQADHHQDEHTHLDDPFIEPLPKAVDFAKRFKWSIIGFVAFMFIAIVLAVNYSTKITIQQTVVRNIDTNSDASIAKIQEIDAMNVPMVLLQNWALLVNGHQYAVYQDGQGNTYAKVNGVNRPLKDGDVIYKDGKAYVYKDGKFVPLDITDGNKSPYHTGDLVYKDGKLYQVGADGKLHPYQGKLKPGQIVWKDGKAYVVGADGKLHPVGAIPLKGNL